MNAKIILDVCWPLFAMILVAIAFVCYAVCHVGGRNDAHIDRIASEKENHGTHS